MKTIRHLLFSIVFISCIVNSFGQKNPDKFIAVGLQTDAQLLFQDNPRFPFSNSLGIFYQNYLFSNWSISLAYAHAQRRYYSFSTLSPIDNGSSPTPFVFVNDIFTEKSYNLKAAIKYYYHTPKASYFATIGAIQKVAYRTRGEVESTFSQDDINPYNNSKRKKNIGFDFGVGFEYDVFENIILGIQAGSHLFVDNERGKTSIGGFLNEEKKGGFNNFYLQLQIGYAFDIPAVSKRFKKK